MIKASHRIKKSEMIIEFGVSLIILSSSIGLWAYSNTFTFIVDNVDYTNAPMKIWVIILTTGVIVTLIPLLPSTVEIVKQARREKNEKKKAKSYFVDVDDKSKTTK